MAKRISQETIKMIKSLREKGWSMPEIREKVKVGHGSIFRYIKNVRVLPQFQRSLSSKRGGSIRRMKFAEERAFKQAKRTISTLSEKEKAIFLSALYWGEGSKSDFGLSNTDSELIKVFVNGLEKVFHIPKEHFRVSLRIYEDLNKEKCLDYWSKIIGIPPHKFVNVNILRGKKTGKLPYGMCRIRIKKGGDLLKYITALKKQVVELF